MQLLLCPFIASSALHVSATICPSSGVLKTINCSYSWVRCSGSTAVWLILPLRGTSVLLLCWRLGVLGGGSVVLLLSVVLVTASWMCGWPIGVAVVGCLAYPSYSFGVVVWLYNSNTTEPP